jgi:hypothetical protein
LEKAYLPEFWHEAYVVLGTGAAALAGLVIVAASVRADHVMGARHLRVRARNNTLSMISLLGGSILVLLPQDPTWLGVELIVFHLAWVALPASTIVHELRNPSRSPLHLAVLAAAFYIFSAISGASLIIRWGGGLYLMTAAYFGYLLITVLNAYRLLLQPDPN